MLVAQLRWTPALWTNVLGALFLKAVEEAQRALIRERAANHALRDLALRPDALVTSEPVHC